MVFRLLDRARMSVSGSPGTGNISLGVATTGYQTFFQAGCVDGDEFPYCATDGTKWEYGIATYVFAGNQLSRNVTKTSAQNNTPLSLSNKTIITACLRAEDVASNTTLAGLSDVNITPGSAIDGQVVYWNNADGRFETKVESGGGGGSTTLAGLTDVNVTEGSGINGYTLNWNNGTSKWIATAPVSPGISSAAVSTLTDVVLTSLTSGQVLEWDGTHWVNQTPSGGATTLHALTDVNVTEGSGIDGYFLKWDNGTSKWIAAAGGGGGSALTIKNNGTDVDTAATSINFVNATSITTSSHNVTVTLPTGGGGGGSAPTVVQSMTVTQSDGPVVLGSAPTAGNLLVAIVAHWNAGTFDAGWTLLDNLLGSATNDYIHTFYKIALSGESASQNPVSGTYQSTTIFEVSGASNVGLHASKRDIVTATPTLSLIAPANALILGQVGTTSGAGVAPSSITGATQGSTATLGSGSGAPRAGTAFTKTTTVAGGFSVIANYGAADNSTIAAIVLVGG